MKKILKWLIPCLVACFMVAGLVQNQGLIFAEDQNVQDESGEISKSSNDVSSTDFGLKGDESLSGERASDYKTPDKGTTTEIDKGVTFLNVGETMNLGYYPYYGNWTSDDSSIVTVDQYGNITGISSSNGQAVQVKHSYIGISGRNYVEIYSIYVNGQTATYEEYAQFYYLKTPTSDPVSNDTDQWGTVLGIGTINTEDIVWTENKNCFISTTPERVVAWPAGYGVTNADGSYTLNKDTSDNSHWMAIFNAYKDSVSSDLKVDIGTEDIESIILHPYKISKNNGTNPDKHVDCTVEIKVTGIVTATFYVMEPGSTSYEWKEATNYKLLENGKATVNGPKGSYEAEKDYNGIRYVFDGWYTDEACSETNKVTFDLNNGIDISSNTNFYAKYVPKTVTINYLALENGKVSNSSETVNVTGNVTGSTATPNENYKFVGWYSNQNCAEENLVSTKATLDETELTKINQVSGEWQNATYYAKFEKAVQDITVKKNVSGSYGDKTQLFTFSYSFTNLDGETVASKESISLSNGQEFVIQNVPYGAVLTITESDSDGYVTTAKYGTVDSLPDTGSPFTDGSIAIKTVKGNNFVLVDNCKESVPITGITDNTPKGLGMIGTIVAEVVAIAFVLKKKRQLKM
ncbi:MAG: InlB B-repeat-containing protein [Floccifex sp.]